MVIIIKKGGKYGAITPEGIELLPSEFEKLIFIGRKGNNYFFKAKKNKLYGLITANIKNDNKVEIDVVLPFNFQDILYLFDNYLAIKQNNKWKIYDYLLQQYVSEEYYDDIKIEKEEDIFPSIKDLLGKNQEKETKFEVRLFKNATEFYINKIDNEIVITPYLIWGKWKVASRNDKYAIINIETFEPITPFIYDFIDFNLYRLQLKRKLSTHNFFRVEIGDKHGIIDNETGETILPVEYDNIRVTHYYVSALKDNKLKIFLAEDFSLIYEQNFVQEFEIIDNLLIIQQNGKYGILDLDNSEPFNPCWVVKPEFDLIICSDMTSKRENPIPGVLKKAKYEFILYQNDKTGLLIYYAEEILYLPPKWQHIAFYEKKSIALFNINHLTVYPVSINDKWNLLVVQNSSYQELQLQADAIECVTDKSRILTYKYYNEDKVKLVNISQRGIHFVPEEFEFVKRLIPSKLYPLSHYILVKTENKYGIFNTEEEKYEFTIQCSEEFSFMNYTIFLENGKLKAIATIDLIENKVKTYTFDYDVIVYTNPTPTTLLIKANNKFGIFDTDKLKILLPPEYDEIKYYFIRNRDITINYNSFSNSLKNSFNPFMCFFLVRKKNKWGLFLYDGKEKLSNLLPVEHSVIVRDTLEESNFMTVGLQFFLSLVNLKKLNELKDKLLNISNLYISSTKGRHYIHNNKIVDNEELKKGMWNFSYLDGNEYVKLVYRNLFLINPKGKVGAINKEGKLTIPLIYDSIALLYKDKLLVSKNNRMGIVNIDNNIIVPIKYKRVYKLALEDYNIVAAETEDNKIYIYDVDEGKLLLDYPVEEAEIPEIL